LNLAAGKPAVMFRHAPTAHGHPFDFIVQVTDTPGRNSLRKFFPSKLNP